MSERIFFSSRRNSVWREGDCVYKRIVAGEDRPDPVKAAEQEADLLQLLHKRGVSVPKVVSLQGDLLILEYVKGITLTDEIERQESGISGLCPAELAETVAEWFEAYYDAVLPGMIRGDVNCRNFILTEEGRLFGVDFEQQLTGRTETDLGRLTAFILTYDPPRTAVKYSIVNELYRCFQSAFSVDPIFVREEQDREFEAMRLRRGRFSADGYPADSFRSMSTDC